MDAKRPLLNGVNGMRLPCLQLLQNMLRRFAT